jgi:hypothetical protein
MKLFELLQSALLVEHLGNLIKLDRKFLDALKTDTDPTRKKNIDSNTFNPADKLKSTLGRDSEFVQITYKSGADFLELLKEPLKTNDDKTRVYPNASGVYVFLNSANNKQCFIIVASDWKYWKVGIDAQAFTDDQYKLLKPQIEKTSLSFHKENSRSGVHFLHNLDFSQLSKIMAALNKTIFKAHKPIVYAIQRDEKRDEKQRERKSTRAGATFAPSIPDSNVKKQNEFKRNARLELAKRLDNFKASKSKVVDNIDQVQGLFQEHGPLEKLKIDGYDYTLFNNNSNFSFKSLLSGEAYIEYEINENTTKVKNIKNEIKNKMKSIDKWNDSTLNAITTDYGVPPPSFRVFVKMDGNKIVPLKISLQTSSSANWYY